MVSLLSKFPSQNVGLIFRVPQRPSDGIHCHSVAPVYASLTPWASLHARLHLVETLYIKRQTESSKLTTERLPRLALQPVNHRCSIFLAVVFGGIQIMYPYIYRMYTQLGQPELRDRTRAHNYRQIWRNPDVFARPGPLPWICWRIYSFWLPLIPLQRLLL